MIRQAIRRAEDLPGLGHFFLKRINPHVAAAWPRDVFDQASALFKNRLTGPDKVTKAAYSLLVCKLVIQVPLNREEILTMAWAALGSLGAKRKPMFLGRSDDGKRPTYSSKGGLADTKVNLRFGRTWKDTESHYPRVASAYQLLSGYTRDFTDDQACCALLMAAGLSDVRDGTKLAILAVMRPDRAKALSTALKSLGANSHELGARLVEMETLRGKGVGRIDLRAKALERTQAPGTAGGLADLDMGRLKEAVRRVIRKELAGKKVLFDPVETFWDSRWRWCVNGGHARALEHSEPEWKVERGGRVHRRVALEEWSRNPLPNWKGEVYVSASEKLENGKSRLILACDTLSYVCFEHMLRPIERVWRNERVLLDPGSLGHGGTAQRVRELGGDRGLWLMLDYDDFNSQHTLASQKLVIEELGHHTGYPPILLHRLVHSFERMHVVCGSETLGLATATLMSGHRGTTMLNSILNAAYLSVATDGLIDRLSSLHTGDDIVTNAENFEIAGKIIAGCEASKLRMNPMKMSIGRVGAEFLRIAIRRSYCTGYLARAVAATVSGNWVTDEVPSARESLQSFVQAARTLCNRGRDAGLWRLLLSNARKSCGIASVRLRPVLAGKVALGAGPAFSARRVYRSVGVAVQKTDFSRDVKWDVPKEATVSYLSKCARPEEIDVMNLTGSSLMSVMLSASYSKTEGALSDEIAGGGVGLISKAPRTCLGVEFDYELVRRGPSPGLLEGFPLLNLLRSRMDTQITVNVLRCLGWDGRGDPEVAAWGTSGQGAVIDGVTSYSDAAYMVQRATTGCILITRPVFV